MISEIEENQKTENKTENNKIENIENFQKPHHWVDLEELTPAYWSNEKQLELRGQEFSHKPLETLERLEKLDQAGFARRDFLTLMGASMALASVSCMRRPVHKIIPYVNAPEHITPGVPVYYTSVYSENGQEYGVLVKTREGRPIKLEGNPEHKMSSGALSARAQASLLNLYDPDRLKTPIKYSSRGGVSESMEWGKLNTEILAHLKAAPKGSIRVVSPSVSGPATRNLLHGFLGSLGGSEKDFIEYSPAQNEDVLRAHLALFGVRALPRYLFDRADTVVSMGSDFLGEDLYAVKNTRDWAKKRKLSSGSARSSKMSKLYCFESIFSLTGSNADERTPIRPTDELKVVMALAHELILTRAAVAAPNDRFRQVLVTYAPEKVGAEIQSTAFVQKIKRIADDLIKSRGRSILTASGVHAQSEDGVSLQLVVAFLNHALGNYGNTIHINAPLAENAQNTESLKKLVVDMNAGRVSTLIINELNPAYIFPEGLGFSEALKKVKKVIQFSDRVSETSSMVDYVLAQSHFLESWGDVDAGEGLLSIRQPTISPLHKTKSLGEVIISWMEEGELNVPSSIAWLFDEDFEEDINFYEYIKGYWRQFVLPKAAARQDFRGFWEAALKKGVVEIPFTHSTIRSPQLSALNSVPAMKSIHSDGLYLGLYLLPLGDGSFANNAWMQELPQPMSTVTWDNYLNIAPEVAKKLNLKTNDVVELTVGTKKINVPVLLQPGMHPGSLSLALGYGRTASGYVGNNKGINAFPLVQIQGDSLIYSGQSVSLKKTGRRYELAMTQGHFKTLNRPIINDLTLDQFQKDPSSHIESNPPLFYSDKSIWPKFEYNGYRWGMTVDLNSCTGCSACVVACQAENNIPVVGRDRVLQGREMHWIRIDRYYSGEDSNPQVVYQPMMCQHCENASCETVCPVLATVHSSEGLNEMVYNRCVGTRYCQNNCPYKVRRFNFFDHWKEAAYKDTMNLAWNPDVTVRSRGIMEKCTFCIQRIEKARSTAKTEGRPILDGDIKTACQQTCPTDAIVFGNTNDSKSQVSKLRAEKHAFTVLQSINNKPQIHYLTKVRNNNLNPFKLAERKEDDGHH